LTLTKSLQCKNLHQNYMLNEKKVYQALETVLDPELGIDIVSLGLIYEVEVLDRSMNNTRDQSTVADDDRLLGDVKSVSSDQLNIQEGFGLIDQPIVRITMTLTTPGCPLAPIIDQMVREAVGSLPEVASEDNIEIALTFDPPWVPDMMSEEARAELGR